MEHEGRPERDLLLPRPDLFLLPLLVGNPYVLRYLGVHAGGRGVVVLEPAQERHEDPVALPGLVLRDNRDVAHQLELHAGVGRMRWRGEYGPVRRSGVVALHGLAERDDLEREGDGSEDREDVDVRERELEKV